MHDAHDELASQLHMDGAASPGTALLPGTYTGAGGGLCTYGLSHRYNTRDGGFTTNDDESAVNRHCYTHVLD